MNKRKKRLIASLSAVAIIVLSLALGKTNEKNNLESAELSNATIQSMSSIFNTSNPATKIILKNGNSDKIIQKISVNGEIGSAMTDEEVTHSVIDQIKIATNDDNVQAILLSVNTPGGGVYESYEIYKALLDSGKDVYVSMKNQATSGGYYISMAAKKIFATDETITGSIGVVMSSLSAQKFLEDKGIKNQVIRSGAQKAVGGLTEDMPESTVEIYREINKEYYDKFVDIIVKGRNIDREKVVSLADGRIYSGKQALANGLIDKLGTEKELIDLIKEDKGLDNPEIVEYRKAEVAGGLLSSFMRTLAESLTTEVKNQATSNGTVKIDYLG